MTEGSPEKPQKYPQEVLAAIERARSFAVAGVDELGSIRIRTRIETLLRPFPQIQEDFLMKVGSQMGTDEHIDVSQLRSILEPMNVHVDALLDLTNADSPFNDLDGIEELHQKIYNRHGDETEYNPGATDAWLNE